MWIWVSRWGLHLMLYRFPWKLQGFLRFAKNSEMGSKSTPHTIVYVCTENVPTLAELVIVKSGCHSAWLQAAGLDVTMTSTDIGRGSVLLNSKAVGGAWSCARLTDGGMGSPYLHLCCHPSHLGPQGWEKRKGGDWLRERRRKRERRGDFLKLGESEVWEWGNQGEQWNRWIMGI